MVNAFSFFDPESARLRRSTPGESIFTPEKCASFISPTTVGRSHRSGDPKTLKLRYPEKAPEIAAYLSVVDEFQPEVEADMHGVDLRYNGQLVFQSAGAAGSNYSMRPWDWRFTEAMRREAEKEGYGSSRWEADTQADAGRRTRCS